MISAFLNGVVLILMAVSEMPLDTAQNAGSGISEYASLCTDLIPRNSSENFKVVSQPDKTTVFLEGNSWLL